MNQDEINTARSELLREKVDRLIERLGEVVAERNRAIMERDQFRSAVKFFGWMCVALTFALVATWILWESGR